MPDTIKPEEQNSQNTEIETQETSKTTPKTEAKAETKKPQDKPQPKKLSKGLIIGLVSAGAIIVLVAGGAFLRLGNQTVLARTFDSIGQHETALSLDLMSARGFGNKSKVSTSNLSMPDNCESLINLTNYSSEDYSAISGNMDIKVAPVNPTFKDKFYYNAFYKQNVNLNDIAADIYTNQEISADTDFIQKVSGASSAPKSYGQVTVSGSAEGIVKAQDAAYLNLMNVSIATKDSNVSDGLSGWYKQDFNFKDPQKEGVKDVADVLKSNLKVKPETIFSKDSLQQVYGYACAGLDKVSVGAPEKVNFGSGEHAVSRDVRPLAISTKSDTLKIYTDRLPDLVGNINKDETLKNFLKGKYDDAIKLGKAVDKITEQDPATTSTPPTKDEWNKSVDMFFEKVFTKDAVKQALAQNGEATNAEQMFTIQTKPIQYYLSMDTLEPYGANSEMTITPTAKYFESYNLKSGDDLYDLLKDGISIKENIYDMRIGSNAPKISIPTDSKPFSQFMDDFQKTAPAQSIEKELNQNMPAPAATSPSDSKGGAPDNSGGDNPGFVSNPDGTYTLPDGTVVDPAKDNYNSSPMGQ